MKKLAFLIVTFVFCGPAQAETATIAVAANFTDATRDIVPLFEKATGHTVKVSYGSTGKLYAQIENGAPFDAFLAADINRPSKAERDGLAVNGTRFTYAKGKLALWSAKPGRFEDGGAYLKTGDFERVAIANPKTAPYGLAALQVLEHLALDHELQGKLVQGDSIAQTFQFVVSGNAEIGFVALSQVRAWKGDKGSAWEIPEPYYAPIEQQAILLTRGADNPAAWAFLAFLKGAEARTVITRYGYGVE
ncbi:MAG: molybdate ABC transporter substrate-binding protein [Gammaproteobacteria bacterium]|nr:molybdate ABC transporter substrate-binding protein [Gammaproteobacteria bacterium]